MLHKFVYNDVKWKIKKDLDCKNLMKRRMYWRGFAFALYEYADMPSAEYGSLKEVINEYGSEGNDYKGLLWPTNHNPTTSGYK